MRALRYATATLLLFAIFEACSNTDTVTPAAGPATLSIASISLGQGDTGEGGASSTLACDHTIGVTLAITNWTLLPPGMCSQISQCGQVRVSLLKSDGTPIGNPQVAATVSVDLKLDDLMVLNLLPAPGYIIKAELVLDSGDLFDAGPDGNSVAQKTFYLAKKVLACPEPAAGGAGGAAPSEGGAAGFGGTPELGQAGGAGQSASAGEGGTSGTGGTSGASD